MCAHAWTLVDTHGHVSLNIRGHVSLNTSRHFTLQTCVSWLMAIYAASWLMTLISKHPGHSWVYNNLSNNYPKGVHHGLESQMLFLRFWNLKPCVGRKTLYYLVFLRILYLKVLKSYLESQITWNL